jgi:hypothetical protein
MGTRDFFERSLEHEEGLISRGGDRQLLVGIALA